MGVNPCNEIELISPLDELMKRLVGALHVGTFWTRAEYKGSERYDLHFTVLTVSPEIGQSKVLVHDGALAGQIMSLYEFEDEQWDTRCDMISYWPVMDDEIDRVRFAPSW